MWLYGGLTVSTRAAAVCGVQMGRTTKSTPPYWRSSWQRGAFREGMAKAKPQLLEPVMKVSGIWAPSPEPPIVKKGGMGELQHICSLL